MKGHANKVFFWTCFSKLHYMKRGMQMFCRNTRVDNIIQSCYQIPRVTIHTSISLRDRGRGLIGLYCARLEPLPWQLGPLVIGGV